MACSYTRKRLKGYFAIVPFCLFTFLYIAENIESLCLITSNILPMQTYSHGSTQFQLSLPVFVSNLLNSIQFNLLVQDGCIVEIDCRNSNEVNLLFLYPGSLQHRFSRIFFSKHTI